MMLRLMSVTFNIPIDDRKLDSEGSLTPEARATLRPIFDRVYSQLARALNGDAYPFTEWVYSHEVQEWDTVDTNPFGVLG